MPEKAYLIIWLKPADLNLDDLAKAYPQAELMDVSPEWLGTKNRVMGYNKIMISKEFYDLFSDTEYILIYHTDAWVFRDELSQWYDKGYDLAAPPLAGKAQIPSLSVEATPAITKHCSELKESPIRKCMTASTMADYACAKSLLLMLLVRNIPKRSLISYPKGTTDFTTKTSLGL